MRASTCWPPKRPSLHGALLAAKAAGYRHVNITIAFKKPKNGQLTDVQQMFNKAHNGLRAIGQRGNALLKTTFKALYNISLDPWRVGKIVAAALVLLHFDHARTA
ncbi:MAG: hypothetical protein QOC92_4815 [Acidimicrobiaceae bacterium]|jgi:hypothetical protein